MKKSFYLVILFFLTTVVCQAGYRNYKEEIIAEPVPFCPQPFLKDGLYFGAGLGYDSYNIRIGSNLFGVVSTATRLSPAGPLGELLMGYGRYFDWFYYGGELFGTLNGAKVNDSTITSALTYNTSATIQSGWGVSLLPGIRFSNTALIYGRVGYSRTSIKAQENVPGFGIFNTNTNWYNGLNFGVGMETLVYNNVSLRGEFIHTDYSDNITILGNEIEPNNNQFIISLLYHFC